jgi:hypothetical protein
MREYFECRDSLLSESAVEVSGERVIRETVMSVRELRVGTIK